MGRLKAASLEEVRTNDYKLTPGLYVGFEETEDNGPPFDVKMPQLIDELETQFSESNRLQERIEKNLKGLLV